MKNNISFSRKTFLKIISVLVAIIAWFFITYTENPQIDYVVGGIDVSFAQENVLSEKGLMIVNKSNLPKASVEIRGKRGDIIGVMDNIGASVDVSKINEAGTYKLKTSFDIPSNAVYILERRTINIEVEIEKIEDKTVDVYVFQKKKHTNKDILVKSEPEITQIKIKGAKDDLEKINHAAVYVDTAELSEKRSEDAKIVYEDIEGQEVGLKNQIITEAQTTVVNSEPLPKKILPVAIVIPDKTTQKYDVGILFQKFLEIEVGVSSDAGERADILTVSPDGLDLIEGKNKYLLPLDRKAGIFIPYENRKMEFEIEIIPKTQTLEEDE